MSDHSDVTQSETHSGDTAAPSATAGQFTLQRCYIKDVSFEAPHTPGIFLEEWQPQVDVQMNNRILALGEDTYECVLWIRVTAKVGEKVAFLVEVQQAGVFTIAGFSDEEKDYLHGTLCPATLYPYAREAISDLVTKGSFPQFLLAPINFEYLYHTNRKQKALRQRAEATNATASTLS